MTAIRDTLAAMSAKIGTPSDTAEDPTVFGLAAKAIDQTGGETVPANALTLNGEPLTLNGEILTLGA